MPPVVEIRRVSEYAGQEVILQGWLYNLRESGKLLFPLFRDGTGIIQGVVVKSAVPPEVFDAVRGLTQESSVRVTGKVRADKRAPGGFELDVSNVEVLQRIPAETPYPITPKDHGIEFLMDHRHLWLRSTRQRAILGVRHEIIKAVRDFFDDRGFTLVDTPIFTPAACEGTTTLFEVNYFDDKAYLTQSGQLYNEAAAMAVGKTYCFGPTFRAEKSKTRRHLTEFWMVEPEVAFAHLDDAMTLGEELVAFVVGRVLEKRRPELQTLERKIENLEKIKLPFPAPELRRGREDPPGQGKRNPVGRRLRRHGRNAAVGGLRKAPPGASLSQPGEGFYMAPDPGAPGSGAVRGHARSRRLRRNHRRRRAPGRPRAARATHCKSSSCRARPSSGISTCAVTAPCRMRASAWASSASWPGSAGSNTCARPFLSRACCTG